MVLSTGLPFSPWQPAQTWAFSAIVSARAPAANKSTTAPQIASLPTINPSAGKRSGANRVPLHRKLLPIGSVDRERDDVVAALIVELGVTARPDHNILLGPNHVARWWRVHTGAGAEAPQLFAVGGVVGSELAIAFSGEHQAPGGGENASNHRLGRLDLPLDLAGVVVHRRDVTRLLLARDHLEGAAQPQLAVRIRRVLDVIGHRLVQVDGVGQLLSRVGRNRRPFDAAVGARQHARAFLGRQHPHVLLRHHRFREAYQAAILAIVHVDVPGLASVDNARNRLAVL